MFERVSLWTSSSDVEQLSQHHHARVGLATATCSGQDDRLVVSSLSLNFDGFLSNFVESWSILGGFLGGVEGDGVAHVIVRVDGDQDWSNVGLEFE